MALPAGRKGVLPSEITPEGKLKIPTPPSELPSYSSSDEGKVLSVDSNGNLKFVTPEKELPSYSSSDEGKVLEVDSQGKLEFNIPEKELPSYSSSDEGKVLSVDSNGGLEFTTPQAGGKVYLHNVHVGAVGVNCNEMFVFYSSDPTPLVTGDLFRGYLQRKGFISKDKLLPAIGKWDASHNYCTIGVYARSASDDSRCLILKSDFTTTDAWDLYGNEVLTDNVIEM